MIVALLGTSTITSCKKKEEEKKVDEKAVADSIAKAEAAKKAEVKPAEDPKNLASPPDSTTVTINKANIKIAYSKPSVKGRPIWGTLVPYNEVWRAGANAATVFSTDKDIMVEGKKLPAGQYSLFMIPTEKDWTIIFDKTLKQWGSFKYDKDGKTDALRVTVKPTKVDAAQEVLKYEIVPTKGNLTGNVELTWEKIKVSFKVK
ncbi:MAG: DUF2911 domain-containing protein [Bacteroidetes bacterium]|nr:MAG: DUF2911 domain-containing protein [Bacteroidota bacterium]